MKKNNLYDNLIIHIVCIWGTLIGLMFTQNEIPMDNWFIEASADGLFGNSNTGLMVLCGNFMLTAIIWILSKTGLRVFWLHVLMVIFQYIGTYLVCKIVKQKVKKRIWICIMIVYNVLLIPYLYSTMCFTITASYVIACGLAWIMYCKDTNLKKSNYIIGFICLIMGISFRWDCVLFGGAFCAGAVAVNVITQLFDKKRRKKILEILNSLVPYIISFSILVVIVVVQFGCLNYFESGFDKWNSIRTKVDDYEIPIYEDATKEYLDIGVSENDYALLKSWNNYDPEFYTSNLYSDIIKMKKNDISNKTDFINEAKIVLYNFFDNVFCQIAVLIFIIALLMRNRSAIFHTLSIIIVYIFLLIYFQSIGRLIYRIEFSMYVALAVMLMYVLIMDGVLEKLVEQNKIKYFFFVCVFSIIIMPVLEGNGIYNNFRGKSIIDIYTDMNNKEDTYGRYILNKINSTTKYSGGVTMNNGLAEKILADKENFYFFLFCDNWKQVYPLTDRDIFRTAKVGTASNMGVLGLYFPKLSVMRNNFKNYNVTNPFESLTDDNVFVVVRKNEADSRTNEIEMYLEEHYDMGVKFSIVEEIEDVVVGKYTKEK